MHKGQKLQKGQLKSEGQKKRKVVVSWRRRDDEGQQKRRGRMEFLSKAFHPKKSYNLKIAKN